MGLADGYDTISLLALDLDGTLFRKDTSVSERSIAALEACRRKGLTVAIATARPLVAVEGRLDERLWRGIPWVCSNGAAIYEDRQCVYTDALPADTAREVLQRLESHEPHFTVSMEMGGRMYINEHLDLGPIPFEVAELSRAVDAPVTRIQVTMGPDFRELPAMPTLPEGCEVRVSDGGRSAQVLSPTATKESGLLALLDRLGLGFEHVMAFGDDVTDMGMLQRSAVGVAMGNAVPELIAIADRVALTNEEDGVAVVLEELLASRGQGL